MGRTDAVQVTLEVVARMRALDPRLTVTYEPGWERRGNGSSANFSYANVHHTASASSAARPFPTQSLLRDGRPDLSGPLCNEAGPWCTVEAPRVHVVAAHPANHAGASRASGPVPALALYNPRTRGLEIDYAGSSPMAPGQLHVAHLWTRANADVLASGDVEIVRAHAETSVTGKWDPGYAEGRTIAMTDFRAAAKALGAPIPATPEDDDVTFLMRNAKGTVVLVGPGFSEWVPTTADHKALSGTYPQFQLSDDLFNRIHAAARSGLGSSQSLAAITKDLADEEPATAAQIAEAVAKIPATPST